MTTLAETSGPRILVADDDAMTRMLFREALEAGGFKVVEAENGLQVLAEVARVRPDLAILDVVMPGMDGFEVCAALRQDSQFANLPVLMLTSLDDVTAVARAFDAGASDFANKPISWNLLVHRVQYVLRAHRTSEDLWESQLRLGRAQRIAKLGYWEIDLPWGQLIWSPEVPALLGIDDPSVVPAMNALLNAVHPEDLEAVNAAIDEALKTGHPFSVNHRTNSNDSATRVIHVQGEILADRNGTPMRMTGTVQDITARIASEQRIRFLASYDTLTNLPNRVLFGEQLVRMLAEAQRRRRMVAVLSVDLDEFKRVNETLGHKAGDFLLKSVADRLAAVIRTEDGLARATDDRREAVARLGDDEFIIALGGLERVEDAARVATRVLEAVKQPIIVDGKELFLSASVGVSMCPQDSANEETLLKHADAALHHAKEAGRNCFHFFQASMNEAALRRLALEGDLRRALERREFVLYYQPQVDAVTGRMRSTEALIRWDHPERGVISPATFIDLAEQTSLIHSIGQWVVADASRQAREWRDKGLKLHVAVNISARQFRQSDIVEMLMATVRDVGFDPGVIELELTESMLMEDLDAATETLSRLKALGFRLALDDFGKGYSSLAYLKRFPIDVLKIDRLFIQNLPDDRHDRAIVSAIVSLARDLNIEPLAEGVEHAGQRDCLLSLGCSMMQGYFFGRPMPAEGIGTHIAVVAG
jgi:diguanylate cyclase (GGDEF)-like protein